MAKHEHDLSRAEARRRNRLAAKSGTVSPSEAPQMSTPSGPGATATGEVPRTGILAALRSSFGAAPIRADLAFFPSIAATRVLIVPLIATIATAAFAIQPAALASTWVQLVVQSLLLPPAFVLSFLGGMLTRRASWLAGGVIGIITFAGGMFVAAAADLAALDAKNPVRLVLEIYAQSSNDLGALASNVYGAAVMGIFAGAFAGWYGRFLRAAGPRPRSAKERRRRDAEQRKGNRR